MSGIKKLNGEMNLIYNLKNTIQSTVHLFNGSVHDYQHQHKWTKNSVCPYY